MCNRGPIYSPTSKKECPPPSAISGRKRGVSGEKAEGGTGRITSATMCAEGGRRGAVEMMLWRMLERRSGSA